MTYQTERDEFISRLTREIPTQPPHMIADLARGILRAASTLDRLAVAQCNGDWPADNGERKTVVCPICECGWVPSSLAVAKSGPHKGQKVCQDCRTEERLTATLKPYGIEPIYGGDPRGYVVKLKMPSGATNTWSQDGIGVPTRSR